MKVQEGERSSEERAVPGVEKPRMSAMGNLLGGSVGSYTCVAGDRCPAAVGPTGSGVGKKN